MNEKIPFFSHDSIVDKVNGLLLGRFAPSKDGEISDVDCLMTGLAMFRFKFPSMLQFDRAHREDKVLRSNLRKLFHIKEVPSDTYLRERLDEIDPNLLRPIFSHLFAKLQRDKKLENFVFHDGYYIVSLDGTGYFSSSSIHCSNCCVKEHKDGKKTYYHQAYCGALVHPDQKTVIPFPPEPILQQDGTNKNDCEREAAKRWLMRFRKEHPHLKIIVVADGLAANGPFVKTLLELKMQFILVCKDGDHAHLLQEFRQFSTTCVVEDIEYQYANGIPLNATHDDLLVNVVRYKDKGKTWMFVTSFELNEENIAKIARGGRARWKIENETFNTLKNQGYNFEHNYGHGNKNLSTVFVFLMLLAFFIDQILEFADLTYQKVRMKLKAKTVLFERVRNLLLTFDCLSFEEILHFILDPPRLRIA